MANTTTDKDFALVGSNIGTISGTVTDAGTSSPVSGVTVSYSGGNTTTDGSGNYTLSGVAAGTYTVTASKTGYTTKAVNNVSVTGGNTTDQDFALPQLLFSDDFESGNMNAWTTNNNMTVQTTSVHGGTYAGEANASGTAANARKTLASGQGTVFYRAWFNINSQDTNGLGLVSVRDTGDVGVMKTYVDGTTGYLCVRNEITSSNTCSTTAPTQDAWHSVELQVVVNGTSSTHKVWYNGSEVTALTSTTANLGSTNIGRLALGEVNSGRTHDIFFDDVIVQNSKVD